MKEAPEALYSAVSRAGRALQSISQRMCCDLTGGYDSRMIVSSFSAAGLRFQTTVTGTEQAEDVRIAGRLAAAGRFPHTFVRQDRRLSPDAVLEAAGLTDGEYDPIEYAQILAVHKRLSQRADLSVNGTAGELARGKHWSAIVPHVGARRRLDAYALVSSRLAESSSDPTLFDPRIRIDVPRHFATMVDRENDGLEDTLNTVQIDSYYLLRMRAWQGRIASSTDQIWRTVSPFLFRSVLETTLAMTPKARWRSLAARRMMLARTPVLARIPLATGYPPLPLNPKTLPRFWRLPFRYTQRAVSKAARMAGLQLALQPSSGRSPTDRAALRSSKELRSLMDPREMRTVSLLDPLRAELFCRQAMDGAFAFEGSWARLLGVETAFRAAERIARMRPLEPAAGLDAHVDP